MEFNNEYSKVALPRRPSIPKQGIINEVIKSRLDLESGSIKAADIEPYYPKETVYYNHKDWGVSIKAKITAKTKKQNGTYRYEINLLPNNWLGGEITTQELTSENLFIVVSNPNFLYKDEADQWLHRYIYPVFGV